MTRLQGFGIALMVWGVYASLNIPDPKSAEGKKLATWLIVMAGFAIVAIGANR